MPYYIKDPKRDPNFDNHPYTCFRDVPGSKVKVYGLGPGPQDWGLIRVYEFRVEGLGFRGLGFRV